MNKMMEKFKNENIAVHCNTQKEYDELMRLLEKYSFRWRSGDKPTCFNTFGVYKSKTYISCDNIIPSLGYADEKYYAIKIYELIECEDFIRKVNIEERTSSLEDCIIIIKEESNSIFKHLCESDIEKEQVENEFEQIEIKQEKTVNGNLINYAVINGQKCHLSLLQYEIIKKLNSILDYIKDDED